MRLAIGSDHCGYEMKQKILPYIKDENEIMDFGCYSTEPVDFPDIAKKVCDAILSGKADRGIMFCSTGIGAGIACNKIKGIRAGVCNDIYSAHQAVEHDNIQILALGGEVVGFHSAKEIVLSFLSAKFLDEEEFIVRINKLEMMDNRV